MTIEELENDYREIKWPVTARKYSGKNTKFIPQTPQIISIFRILLGLTQKNLERKLKLKGRVIFNYESRVCKTLSWVEQNFLLTS